MVRKSFAVTGFVVTMVSLCASLAGAQDKSGAEKQEPEIPSSALPPTGLCRVWLKDVPAGQQPAPTDCASAIRKAPPSATVVFGDRRSDDAAKARAGARGSGGRTSDASKVSAQRSLAPGGSRGLPGGSAGRAGGARGAGAAIQPPPASAKPREKP
ncbi:MAG: hypothetical protein ACHQQ3_00785 [Gemmatimonadales bacterium]